MREKWRWRRCRRCWVDKLELPFPLLSDPGGEQASKPYRVWHEGESYARPAVVIVSPQGEEVFRQVGGEFSDRLGEPELVEKLRDLHRGDTLTSSVKQPLPRDLVQPDPSDGALSGKRDASLLPGRAFAAIALSMRAPDAKEPAAALRDQADRYVQAAERINH